MEEYTIEDHNEKLKLHGGHFDTGDGIPVSDNVNSSSIIDGGHGKASEILKVLAEKETKQGVYTLRVGGKIVE